MSFRNIPNEIVMLLLRVLFLLAVMSIVYHVYPENFFQPFNVDTKRDYTYYGVALIILFSSYLNVIVSIFRIVFRRASGQELYSPKSFYFWLAKALKIQYARDESELQRQVYSSRVYGHPGIIGVANKTRDGGYIWSPLLARHHELIWCLRHVFGISGSYSQGFLDSEGRYLNRLQAYPIAKRYGQIDSSRDHPHSGLFSEAVL